MKPPLSSMSNDLFEEFVSFTKASQLQSSPVNKQIKGSKLSFSKQKVRRRLKCLESDNVTERDVKPTDNVEEKDKNLRKGRSNHRNVQKDSPNTSQQFCPLCQVPLNCLNILPEVHVSSCSVVWDDLRECPHGKNCNETNIFHFKDFSHKVIAKFRATEPVEHLPGPSKINTGDTERRRLSVSTTIISETSPESSLDLFSDEGGSVKQLTSRKKNNNGIEDKTKEISVLSPASQSTYFEASSSDKESIDNNIAEKGNSVTNSSNACEGNHTQIVTSQHVLGSKSTTVCSERHPLHYGMSTGRKGAASDSEESSKSVSILKFSAGEPAMRKPFRVKMPSNILKNFNTISRTDQYSEKVTHNHTLEVVPVDLGKEGATCENSGDRKTTNSEQTDDEDIDSSARTDTTEVFVGKNLQFKGSIKYKRKCDTVPDSSTKSPIKSEFIPCKCLPGSPSEVPSVEMEINSPKKSLVSPVKVHLTYSKTGWQELGIDTAPGVSLDEVNVGLCDCRSAMQVECTVANPGNSGAPPPKRTCLEQKFSSTLEFLGFPGEEVSTQSVKEISVLSSIGQGGAYSTNVAFSQKAVQAGNKEKNKSAKEDWKKLMDRMKARGYADMQVVSSGSVSSSSESFKEKNDMPASSKVKKCPFYKKIPDTTFVVDAFQYGVIPGVTSYFLTHFHSDHYIGLRKGFSKPIYCSAVTAALVKKKIGVDEKFLTVLKLNDERVIGMVRVTALDANHCPGSIMLLFQLPDGRNILHVGDFRFHEVMKSYPAIQRCHINKLFLDTTYCDPRYDFPTQEEVIAKAVQITKTTLERYPKTLIVCGTYLIGKEKVFLGISEAIRAKVWARPDKRGVLKCLCDPNIETRLVTKPFEAQVHVLAMKELNCQDLKSHLNSLGGIYSSILAFRPSGWELQGTGSTLNFKRISADSVTIYGVPYSEHSSYSELQHFVQFLRPEHIVPTVNVGKHAILQRHFTSWLCQTDTSKSQKKLSSYLHVQ